MKIRLGLILMFLIFSTQILFAESPKWEAVEKVFGKKGTMAGEVFKVTFPRSDLTVKVGNLSIEPGLALTSWIAFKPMGDKTMIMGDLVLLEREVEPAMSKLVAAGIEVTALHNHLVGESPRVMYAHFFGQGDAVSLAHKMKNALEVTETPLQERLQPKYMLNWSKIESVLGRTGKSKGNLLQITVPRTEAIADNGMDLPASMGVANAINFQMVGNKVATTGDFVLLASEVNPVVKALTEHGIAVTAIHNHMLYEVPRLFMLHFWGVGDPVDIATGLKAALDRTNSIKAAGGKQ